MSKITDNFCGYINVDDDVFVYNVSKNIVTLLPAQIEQGKRREILNRIHSRDISTPEFLYGVTDDNYEIAMLRNGKFSDNFLGLSSSIKFGTPLVIKASGNLDNFYSMLTEDWNKFHAITFYGGNINAICNPRIAVDLPKSDEIVKMSRDGTRSINIRPWDYYSRSIDFEIDGEKVTLTISISQTDNDDNLDNMQSYSLGKLNSFIRLSFENAQYFNKIIKYYNIVNSLIAILTMCRNNYFQVFLSQRSIDKKYFKTGDCKIFNHYENYSSKKWHNVIPIYRILDWVPNLLDKIVNNEVEPLLVLLPEDNRRVNKISITNVQDLCTALEVAYNWGDRSKRKDVLIEELKNNIKTTIKGFVEKHKDEIDINKETTISSAFQYLDYTLKQKILTLYNENYDIVDPVISKHSLPQINEDSVVSFVKLRNRKTHSGIFEWSDSAILYTALLALVYACLLKNIGMPNEVVKSALSQIF